MSETGKRARKKRMTLSAFIEKREREQKEYRHRARTIEELSRITCTCPACERLRQRQR